MSQNSILKDQSVRFFSLTLIFSWFFWLVCIIQSQEYTTPSVLIPFIIGGLGPAFVSLLLFYVDDGTDGLKKLWQKSTDVKRIGLNWYLLIFLFYPVLIILSEFFASLLTSKPFKIDLTIDIISQPLSLLFFMVFHFAFGPLIEEIAWRGYVLDILQDKYSAVQASLILGSIWSLWHLPLFFIQGTYQNQLGLASMDSLIFFISIVLISIVITWIYNNNQASTLAAILFHWMGNLSGELFSSSSEVGQVIKLMFIFLITCGIFIMHGTTTLANTSKPDT